MGDVVDILLIRKLSVNYKAREWCKLPYPDHPRGCPNYGKRDTCPPSAPLIDDFVDLSRPLYLLAVRFDLAGHVAVMLSKHPSWTLRQARNVLYWQGSVNRSLRELCRFFRVCLPEVVTTVCPEAMGVNVIASAISCGIPMKVKPEGVVYKVALAGYPVRSA